MRRLLRLRRDGIPFGNAELFSDQAACFQDFGKRFIRIHIPKGVRQHDAVKRFPTQAVKIPHEIKAEIHPQTSRKRT